MMVRDMRLPKNSRRRRSCRGSTVAAVVAFIGCVSGASPALADQYDARLDPLFAELQAGPAADAGARLTEIQRIWADSPSDTVDLLYARAMAGVDAGESRIAIDLLDHAIALAPHFAEAYVLRGALRRANADIPGATGDLSMAVALEPRHFLAHRMLAELCVLRGDKRGAYDHLQRALAANPHDASALAEVRRLARDVDGQDI